MDAQLAQATALANEGIEQERAGQFEAASRTYRTVAAKLLSIETTDSAQQQAFTARASDYLTRAQELDSASPTHAPPVAPAMEEPPAPGSFIGQPPLVTNATVAPGEVSANYATAKVESAQAAPESPAVCVAGDGEFTEREVKTGAVAMGGLLGFAAGSIIGMGLLGGAAGAVTATKLADNDSKNGERARQLGVTGAKAIRRISSFNKKHKVCKRTKSAMSKAFDSLTKPKTTALKPSRSCPPPPPPVAPRVPPAPVSSQDLNVA